MHPLQIVFALICFVVLAFGLLWLAGAVAQQVQKRQTFRTERPAHYVESEGNAGGIKSRDTSINTDIHAAHSESPVQNLTEHNGVIWLAQKKKVDGSWALSANAIYEIVKGNRNEVMGWVREARAEAPAEPQAVTPYGGRPYDPKVYQDDPTLAYVTPPQ